MSYILDALRKSEKERALANIPTLRSVSQNEEKEIPLSWFVYAATLVILITALSGLWFGMKSTEPVPLVQKQLKNEQVVNTEEKIKFTVETQNKTESIVTKQQTNSSADNTSDPVPLSELAPSIRARLPELTINALSYSSNHAKRFAMINQDIFKEGEDLGSGIIIEEIRKSSVVLSFAGTRFILRPF